MKLERLLSYGRPKGDAALILPVSCFARSLYFCEINVSFHSLAFAAGSFEFSLLFLLGGSY